MKHHPSGAIDKRMAPDDDAGRDVAALLAMSVVGRGVDDVAD